ncbi:V-set and transmembrane domain-containing protein 4a isoform X1 [Latimeria chalumnae]|uniref:V-set and transmembrane domain-containing protein 4a isoform X1 n=1 Tax=Latimeria chalumnae TaxID=7897 RepID=UPI0003C18E7C|nr:PREDICTED: V-set and transmembrane domain-containing protein 4 [Latimeria chalumnae]|eukprot:XP_006004298.1 PREDICTED: V-set and transmembrane domain-containing protein 4 [Latimeria chalumnae]
MSLFLLFFVLLFETFLGDVCKALNVTVSPAPTVRYMEGDNATLFCHVSQRRKANSALAVRWAFSPSSRAEYLMVKMNKFGIVQAYGNYTRHVNTKRVQLLEARPGKVYKLIILNLRKTDQGRYLCKVQEVGKHRNKWTAWSNGTAATEVQVMSPTPVDDPILKKNSNDTWNLFEDLYLYAVLVCSVGIISVLLFTLIIFCQCIFNKRRTKAKHYLVKCPQNSSGETVTSVTSMNSLSPLQPKKEKKSKAKPETPPAIPAKAPIRLASQKLKLLKPQTGKVVLPKIAEESLTYAELELVKPKVEAKGICTGTVYAKILFEENEM